MKLVYIGVLLVVMMGHKAAAKPLMIAHAGGGYAGISYSNSIEALNDSYAAGFRYIEMDFSWTSDGHLVCLHDWGKTFKKLFNKKVKQALSYTEFEQLVDAHPYFSPCTLASFAGWMSDKPDVKVITDIKDDNLKGIDLMIAQYPALKAQLIPQFYQPEEYPALKDMGFTDLIWILYQYQGAKQSVLELSQRMDLFAVSMRASQAKNKILQQLLKWHRIFVYTINDESTRLKLIDRYQVSGIYTDFLSIELPQ